MLHPTTNGIVCCVQAQYIFLHDAILEGVESGKTDVPADRLRGHVDSLAKMDSSAGETGFEQEFRVWLYYVHNYIHLWTHNIFF